MHRAVAIAAAAAAAPSSTPNTHNIYKNINEMKNIYKKKSLTHIHTPVVENSFTTFISIYTAYTAHYNTQIIQTNAHRGNSQVTSLAVISPWYYGVSLFLVAGVVVVPSILFFYLTLNEIGEKVNKKKKINPITVRDTHFIFKNMSSCIWLCVGWCRSFYILLSCQWRAVCTFLYNSIVHTIKWQNIQGAVFGILFMRSR